jgi:GT2 family glycosyltransferase
LLRRHLSVVSIRVLAVVVTYNRLAMLRECLRSIDQQTFAVTGVLVVDNCSNDGTDNWLRTMRGVSPHTVDVVTTPENYGGAGGFAVGLKAALNKPGYDYVWILDDDCFPEPAALLELLKIAAVGPSSVTASAVLEPKSLRPDLQHRRIFSGLKEVPLPETAYAADALPTEVATASFVSMLVPMQAIRDVGFPFANFLIWCDDTEYCMRLTRAGYPLILVPSSRVRHQGSVAQGSAGHKPWDWRITYGLRNQVATYRLHLSTKRFAVYYAGMLLGSWRGALFGHSGVSAAVRLRETYAALLAGLVFIPDSEPVPAPVRGQEVQRKRLRGG